MYISPEYACMTVMLPGRVDQQGQSLAWLLALFKHGTSCMPPLTAAQQLTVVYTDMSVLQHSCPAL